MCKFLSGIATRKDVIISEYTDSHRSIMALMGLKTTPLQYREFAAFEYSPDSMRDLANIEKYKLTVDYMYSPAWWEERKTAILKYLNSYLRRIIVDDDRKILLGGRWILKANASVDIVENAFIIAMYNSSYINQMFQSSRVGEMYDSSQINEMYDSSSVGQMFDTTRICKMYDLNRVTKMCDSSRIMKMFGMSQVDEMQGSSWVGEMQAISRVHYMLNLSSIGAMYHQTYAPKAPVCDHRKK